ncbi:sigma-70 family RNA polymerase sigma factor [Paludicola sp. MB14-C6]|uniref:RNA polymerase sigma factor n=1 Tax=Paludihabitans sp. MB14-C6 TaxID=3070656 RepID=UPI0027DE4C37|nr:sigma-70 family RNA polymerase sigma factor [Paludicola sp. MB14-C6]WMJ24116.1 sigma-70 family RNA polymerase sigma factor [Paludicola sp. MB14-C6]
MIKSLRTDDCIDEVISQYSAMVYRLALSQTKNSSDADDIFQDVFLRYIKNAPNFDSEEHRKAWLIRVTLNCCKNLWNSSWRKQTTELDESLAFETPEQYELYHTICSLPKNYRAVIQLFYYEDLSIEQISQILKAKPATVRTWLTRARGLLKEQLKGEID